MTQTAPPLTETEVRKAFKGLCGPVIVSRTREDGDFDYFSAEVNFGECHSLPQSFGGCSGSGLWKLDLRDRDGEFELAEIFLGGIAFYQSAPHGDKKYIECHGYRSIYERVLAKLRSQ